MTADLDLVRRIERVGSRAWPAREEIRLGGWLVRFAGGHTGRANSVNPHGPSDDLARDVARCEQLFRARELRPVFRATPLVEPPELVPLLRGRGYVLRSPTRVLTRDLAVRPAAESGGIACDDTLGDAWLDRLVRWYDVPAARVPALRAILEGIVPDRAFATVFADDEPVGGGLAVADEGLVGLFDLVTARERRGRGHGTRLVEGLLAWGAARGASRAYLQVEEDNHGARRLYARLGFGEAYSYAYWVSSENSPYRLPKAP